MKLFIFIQTLMQDIIQDHSQYHLKMSFNPKTGMIYGAQGVRNQMVEKKRIDILSTALKVDLTIYDLPDIEVCYAPPYNSAKDTVNI